MLLHRIFAATLMIGLLAGVLYADCRYFENSYLLHGLFLIGTYFSFREFWVLCRATGHQTFSIWGTLSGCFLVVAHFWSMQIWTHQNPSLIPDPETQYRYLIKAESILYLSIAGAILVTFLLTARRHKYQDSLGGLGVECLGVIYIWFLPSFITRLRHVGEDGLLGGKNWNVFGTKMVIAVIVLAKGCDVFAYLVGRLVGRHKAFPDLSPGKTIEGVFGGLLGSVGLAALLRWDVLGVLPQSVFGWGEALLFGLIVGFAGMMGDLSESLLKRSAGVKDASHTVPGYGGVLDVVDSLTVAGPVVQFDF